MRGVVRIILIGVTLWMLCGIAFAQGERGAITGTILDPSGAAVPDVEIRATEITTGVTYAAKSSTAGYYRIPALPPGTYRVEATKRGFKTAVLENVVVDVAQVVAGDFTLQIGSLTESITVTSEAPVLTPDSPEVGSSVTPTELETWPIAIDDGGRQLQTFIFSSLPGAVGDQFAGSINGGQLFSHEVLIDGISAARPDLNGGNLSEFTPSLDAVGEFKVQTANYSAEYGSSASAIANFSIKSGTNEFHGAAYEYFRNPVLNAAGFNTNAFGTPKGGKKDNNFGATLGGPIRKNRSFFFFAYEGDRFRDFTPGGLITMPTAAMKQGDFSAWLGDQIGTDALGRPVFENEIYDPTTTRTVTAGQIDPVTGLTASQTATIRDPFDAGGQLNAVPHPEFGKGSSVLLPLFPNPFNSNLVRNYPSYSSCQVTLNEEKYTGKLDHVFNPSHKIFGSFTLDRRNLLDCDGKLFPPFPGYPLSPIKGVMNGGPQARFAYDWTINNHTLNHFAMGYNRFNQTNDYAPQDAGYVSKMGITGLDDRCFPHFSFRGHVGQLGRFAPSCVHTNPRESYLWDDTLSYLRGKHSLKIGGEFRRYRYNTGDIGSAAGSWSFNDRETALPGFTGDTGHPFASFILGAVDNGGRDFNVTFPGYRLAQLSAFLQDDWKVTPKLTLNLGLRWDLPFPEKEAFSRMSSFDPTLPNPGADNILGALAFLGNCKGCNGRSSFQDWYFKEFGPRFGLAYAATKKLVLRGGYGISYGAPIRNNFGSHDSFGFNGSVDLARGTSPTGFPLDPVIYWTPLSGAPLPAAAMVGVPPFKGTLPDLDPAAANGSGIDFLPRNSAAQPYIQNWSAGFQYELPREILFEANYIGSKGTRLIQSQFAYGYNSVQPRYIGLGDLLGDDLASDLADPATAPVLAQYGITKLPYPSFEATNFNPTVAQSLRPFPPIDVLLNEYPAMGSSTYHSLQVMARRRPAHGLSFIAAYTYSKTLSNADSALYYPSGVNVFNFSQDFYNRRAEKSITEFDFPHFLKLTWIYQLPFGAGKRWLNSSAPLSRIFGGWSLTAIQNYRSGDPLSIVTEQCTGLYSGAYGDGCSVRADIVPGVPQTLPSKGVDAINGTPFLNPAAFVDPPLTPNYGFAMHFGSAPRFLSKVRGPRGPSEDFGILKETQVNERVKIQFRADFFNAFNRAGRGDPETDVDGGSFGLIYGPASGPRVIQLNLRLKF